MKSSILVLLVLTFLSCETNKWENTSEAPANAEAKTVASLDPATPGTPSIRNSSLIKTAEYRFRTNDLKKSVEQIEHELQKFPAHVSSSNLTLNGSTMESRMTIRVETDYFSDLLKIIDREAAHVHYRNIRTEDVTKQFVDLESRLKTKREVQERYNQILRTKAGKIEELLAAEKQIGELQEEIEATVSRINFLKDQVAYSTINLELYQNITESAIAESEENIFDEFKVAFISGGEGAISVLISLTHLWPLLTILIFGWMVYLRRKRLVHR